MHHPQKAENSVTTLKIPESTIARMLRHVYAIESAKTTNEVLAPLFLLHCEIRDLEDGLPESMTRAAKGEGVN